MTNLEITEEEAKTALNWWKNPQQDHLENIDSRLVKKINDFIGE